MDNHDVHYRAALGVLDDDEGGSGTRSNPVAVPQSRSSQSPSGNRYFGTSPLSQGSPGYESPSSQMGALSMSPPVSASPPGAAGSFSAHRGSRGEQQDGRRRPRPRPVLDEDFVDPEPRSAQVRSTVFLAKLSKTMTAMELRKRCEVYGDVISVITKKDRKNHTSTGTAFVLYKSPKDVKGAIKGLSRANPQWVVELAKRSSSENDPTNGTDMYAVFVGGLDPALITEKALREYFGRYGRIVRVNLVNKSKDTARKNGERSWPCGTCSSDNGASLVSCFRCGSTRSYPSREDQEEDAFCFIRFADKDVATNVIEQEDGAVFLGRYIHVQYCASAELKMEKKRLAAGSPRGAVIAAPTAKSSGSGREEPAEDQHSEESQPSKGLPGTPPVPEDAEGEDSDPSPTAAEACPECACASFSPTAMNPSLCWCGHSH